MGDIVGRLFREFAMTLAVTILVSAFVSLTLTPMMCATLLHRREESEQNWLYHASERGFNSVIAFYGRTLKVVLQFRTVTLIVTLATLAGTILLYIYVPKAFFPVQDTGVILGVSEGPQDASFSAMAERHKKQIQDVLQQAALAGLGTRGGTRCLTLGRAMRQGQA